MLLPSSEQLQFHFPPPAQNHSAAQINTVSLQPAGLLHGRKFFYFPFWGRHGFWGRNLDVIFRALPGKSWLSPNGFWGSGSAAPQHRDAQNNLHTAELSVLCVLNCITVALHCTLPELNLYIFCNICGFAYYFIRWINEKELYQFSPSPAAACTQH